jgi:hypothetical protein
VDSDLAYLAPTLIPVPGAFQADGSNPMISHTAENILFAVKKSMILGDIGKRRGDFRSVWGVRMWPLQSSVVDCILVLVLVLVHCWPYAICTAGSLIRPHRVINLILLCNV